MNEATETEETAQSSSAEAQSCAQVEHTPGPWRSENAIIKSEYDDDLHIGEVAAVFATRPRHLSESEANMRLIAAAPDFKQSANPELLEKAAKHLGNRGFSDLAHDLYGKANDERDALRKTEGERTH